MQATAMSTQSRTSLVLSLVGAAAFLSVCVLIATVPATPGVLQVTRRGEEAAAGRLGSEGGGGLRLLLWQQKQRQMARTGFGARGWLAELQGQGEEDDGDLQPNTDGSDDDDIAFMNCEAREDNSLGVTNKQCTAKCNKLDAGPEECPGDLCVCELGGTGEPASGWAGGSGGSRRCFTLDVSDRHGHLLFELRSSESLELLAIAADGDGPRAPTPARHDLRLEGGSSVRLDRRAWRRESGVLDDGEWVSRWTLCVGRSSGGTEDSHNAARKVASGGAAPLADEAESFALIAVASRCPADLQANLCFGRGSCALRKRPCAAPLEDQTCVHSVCECPLGWGGDDCSLEEGVVPAVHQSSPPPPPPPPVRVLQPPSVSSPPPPLQPPIRVLRPPSFTWSPSPQTHITPPQQPPSPPRRYPDPIIQPVYKAPLIVPAYEAKHDPQADADDSSNPEAFGDPIGTAGRSSMKGGNRGQQIHPVGPDAAESLPGASDRDKQHEGHGEQQELRDEWERSGTWTGMKGGASSSVPGASISRPEGNIGHRLPHSRQHEIPRDVELGGDLALGLQHALESLKEDQQMQQAHGRMIDIMLGCLASTIILVGGWAIMLRMRRNDIAVGRSSSHQHARSGPSGGRSNAPDHRPKVRYSKV